MLGLFVAEFGKRRSLRVAMKMNRILRKIWICSDVLMDILPFFGHAQLGLKLALISPRFEVLVDAYFDGKSELTIWRHITIDKGSVEADVPNLHVFIDYPFSDEFPLPDDRPLPNKIRFKDLQIFYIDHSVLAFLRANQKTIELIKNFKEAFLRATISSASYIIRLRLFEPTEIEPFELKNGRTNEMLTLEKEENNNNDEYANDHLVLKRCQIGRTVQWEDGKTNNFNKIVISLNGNCIGPLSPPKAAQINAKSHPKMNPGPSGKSE